MRLNPAQQVAHTILDEAARRIDRAVVQKGAMAFSQPEYYQRWRTWCNDFIAERLAKTYGSHVLEQDDENRWVWQILPEHANLCHNLPWYTLAMMRVQNRQPSDLVIVQPSNGHVIAAALGAGCHSQDGRARTAKMREPSTSMLYAGEDLPGALRTTGSPLLDIAMVANGNLDAGYWNALGNFLCMAARLLVSESGGLATNSQGEHLSLADEHDSLLIANPELHARLRPVVADM